MTIAIYISLIRLIADIIGAMIISENGLLPKEYRPKRKFPDRETPIDII